MTKFKATNFTLDEFTSSQIATRFGIDNTPDEQAIVNLNWLCSKILDPLRNKLKKPVVISSGYRCPEVNKKAGGKQNPVSQHTKGEAADIYVPGMTAQELFDYIRLQTKLPVDQCILEFPETGGWVHISYTRGNLRGNYLYARKINGKTEYSSD